MTNESKWLVASDSPTAALARFSQSLDFASLTDLEKRAAKRHFLDSLGACVAGIDQPLVRGAASLLDTLSGGGEVPVAGTGRRTDLLSAVYLMAVSCHALELDDGNREGSIHPGTVIVPAVLGLGYQLRASGAAALSAVVAGYEVAVSLAEVLHPHASRRGFQTTGVVGVVGAAAAAARLLSLDATRGEKAMGIAASSGAGLFAYLTGGGNIKKLHPAHAAREGVFAALLAARDVVDGPKSVAETTAGLFHGFGGIHPWTGSIPGQRPAVLAIARSYTKPYPCCRHIHPAIDGLLFLREKHGLRPDEVASVEVGTYAAAMPHATLGWESLTTAQLSFPYVMAAALHTGTIDLETFSDRMRADPALIADTAKIRVQLDQECCDSYPKQGPARVAVTLHDGSRHAVYVADPRGCPELPMSDAELFEKFRMMTAGCISSQAANAIIERVWALETAASIRPLVDAFSTTVLHKVSA